MKAPDVFLVILTFADGSVGVMQFITCEYAPDETPRWVRLATAENIEAEIAKLQAVDDAGNCALPSEKRPVKHWRFANDGEIPEDRTFRDAWRDNGTRLEVSMPAARDLHRNHLRREREPRLAELDVEYMRALEGTAKRKPGEVAAEKQKLRDITKHPAIEAATTPEELKAVTIDG